MTRRRAAAALVAAGLLLLLPACGSSGGSAAGVATHCVRGRPVHTPPQLAHFPFPEGSVLTASRREAGETLVEGYVAGRSLAEVRDALRRDIPARGYSPGQATSGEHEVEIDFSGFAVDGRVTLRDDACAGAVSFGVSARAGT